MAENFNTRQKTHNDMQRQGRLFKILPDFLHAYALLARWDRPIGTWLLWLPMAWGLALGAVFYPIDLNRLVIYSLASIIGAIALRGAGCCFNDLVDRDFDSKVARTAARPLASGAITPRQAILFIIFQLLLGGAVLLLFPWQAWIVAMLSFPLIAIYPFVKRWSFYPQAVLGLTFNWGVWLGFSTIASKAPSFIWEADALLSAGSLYLAGFFWTMGYDTVYAHQDKEDDREIGVKSTALRFERHAMKFVLINYGLMLFMLLLCGWIAQLSLHWWGLAIGLSTFLILYRLKELDFNEATSCLIFFKFNRFIGLILMIGLLLSL